MEDRVRGKGRRCEEQMAGRRLSVGESLDGDGSRNGPRLGGKQLGC